VQTFPEGEEVSRLHGAGGGRHNEEQHSGQGDQRWRLEVKDDRRKLVGGLNARLDRATDWVGEKKNMTESIKWGRKIEE
jgi:hypothetical protein